MRTRASCASPAITQRAHLAAPKPTSLNMSAASMSATLAVGKVPVTSRCVASRARARTPNARARSPALFSRGRERASGCRHPEPPRTPPARRPAPRSRASTRRSLTRPAPPPPPARLRSARKAQASKSRCAERLVPSPRPSPVFPPRSATLFPTAMSEGYPVAPSRLRRAARPPRIASPRARRPRTPPDRACLPSRPDAIARGARGAPDPDPVSRDTAGSRQSAVAQQRPGARDRLLVPRPPTHVFLFRSTRSYSRPVAAG